LHSTYISRRAFETGEGLGESGGRSGELLANVGGTILGMSLEVRAVDGSGEEVDSGEEVLGASAEGIEKRLSKGGGLAECSHYPPGLP
jgi:hypothetical protein